MKNKWGVAFLAVFAMVMFWSFSAQAYTINDSPSDAIGSSIYETYGINVTTYPGGGSTGIAFSLITNFPKDGDVINGSPVWTIPPADVFITENYHGADYLWAVPLVTHDLFNAGTTYAVGSYLTSTDMDPSHGSGYIFGKDVPVQIKTGGYNYGLQNLGAGTVNWTALGSNPDYSINVVLGWYEDDPSATLNFSWGTATCANDIITGQVPQVPIPPSALLLGSGLFGLVMLKRKPWRYAA